MADPTKAKMKSPAPIGIHTRVARDPGFGAMPVPEERPHGGE
jgi:hypothetical protein